MQLSKNFSFEEMTSSASAKRKGIKNEPNAEELANLRKLCNDVLQPIRDAYGKPIRVTSGFRCDKLNAVIGGVKNSQHLHGMAADITSLSDTEKDNMELWNVIIKLAKEGKIECRQIIFEYGHKNIGPSWVHVAINGKGYDKRKNQIVYIGV